MVMKLLFNQNYKFFTIISRLSRALSLFYALEWLSDMQMNNVNFVVDFKTINDVFRSNMSDVSNC